MDPALIISASSLIRHSPATPERFSPENSYYPKVLAEGGSFGFRHWKKLSVHSWLEPMQRKDNLK
jgi:hypothetical protein